MPRPICKSTAASSSKAASTSHDIGMQRHDDGDHIGDQAMIELHGHGVLEKIAPAGLHRQSPSGTSFPSIRGQVL